MRPLATLAASAALALPAHAQATRTITDDTGTAVEIPAEPRRIVSLHDSATTLPLLELGVPPVGSHGRLADDGTPYIRSGATLAGIDFDSSDIAFVGASPSDVEAIAALRPDLILTTEWQDAPVERLRAIAPTVLFDSTKRDDWAMYHAIAEAVGAEDEAQRLRRRYEAQIEEIRALIDTGSVTVSTIHAHETSLFAYNPYGNIGRVLEDAGFAQPEAIRAIPENGWQEFSPETLPLFDADVIVTTYSTPYGETPEVIRGHFESLVPGHCALLHACRSGQMFFVPREASSSASYDALSMTAHALLSLLGGREIAPMPEGAAQD